MRSWLAGATSVFDLGRLGYRFKSNLDWENEMHWVEKMRSYPNYTPCSERDAAFFNSRLHDSWILGVERTASEVRVRLISDTCHDFIWWLEEFADLPRSEVLPKLDLTFHDPIYFRCARASKEGRLRWADWRNFRQGEVNALDSLASDCFFLEDGRIQWAGWVYGWPHDRFLMVDCRRVTVEDRQEIEIARALGPAGVRLWRSLDGYPNPYPRPDMGDMNFWESTMEQLGPTWQDFHRPEE